MGTRGRRSIAELTVVNSPYANKVVAKRPEPRRHLEPAEATEFREIVASLPADYFANHMRVILLECLLAHATEAGHISKLIATCSKQNKPDREFVKLLDMQRLETEMIMRLSRALGLTHQTVYRADSAKQRPALGPPLLFKPWNRQQ
jgi:hypothetical protein